MKAALLGVLALAAMLGAAWGQAGERGRVLRDNFGCRLRADFEAYMDLATTNMPGAGQYMTSMVTAQRCENLRAGTPVLIVRTEWSDLLCVRPPHLSTCLWTSLDAIGE